MSGVIVSPARLAVAVDVSGRDVDVTGRRGARRGGVVRDDPSEYVVIAPVFELSPAEVVERVVTLERRERDTRNLAAQRSTR